MIIHVVDASNPQMEQQMSVVYETLENLGVKDKTIITAFNKTDKMDAASIYSLRDDKADDTVCISAKTGAGTQKLLQMIEKVLRESKIYVEQVVPYDKAGQIAVIRKYGQLLEEEYREDGILVRAYIPAEYGSVLDF